MYTGINGIALMILTTLTGVSAGIAIGLLLSKGFDLKHKSTIFFMLLALFGSLSLLTIVFFKLQIN